MNTNYGIEDFNPKFGAWTWTKIARLTLNLFWTTLVHGYSSTHHAFTIFHNLPVSWPMANNHPLFYMTFRWHVMFTSLISFWTCLNTTISSYFVNFIFGPRSPCRMLLSPRRRFTGHRHNHRHNHRAAHGMADPRDRITMYYNIIYNYIIIYIYMYLEHTI